MSCLVIRKRILICPDYIQIHIYVSMCNYNEFDSLWQLLNIPHGEVRKHVVL